MIMVIQSYITQNIVIEIYTKTLPKFFNENVKVTKPQGSQRLLKYVCIIAINMLTAAVQMGLV